MASLISLALLIFAIGLVGWLVWHSAINRQSREDLQKLDQTEAQIRPCFLIFLSGFATVSGILFLLAHLGCFYRELVLLPALLLLIFRGYRRFRTQKCSPDPKLARRYPIFVLLLAFLAVILGIVVRPYEAVVNSSDAAIYIGTAFHLARTGNLKYSDPLIGEMSLAEREALFKNRFAHDSTGRFARFPGGVPLVDLRNGIVSFSFYHLFPAWLALGVWTLGDTAFVYVQSLFAAVGIIALYLLGAHFGGKILGFCVVLVQLFFFPQWYFTAFPSSELLSQCLFLSGLWVVVSGLAAGAVIPVPYQRLAGVLWGAMFLCRIDAIVLVPLALVVIFAGVSFVRKDWFCWQPLFLFLSLFAFLSAYHQLTTGAHPELISNTISPDHPVYAAVIEFLVGNERRGHLMLVFFFLVFLGFWRWLTQSTKGNLMLSRLEGIVAVGIVGAGLMLFLPQFQLEKLLRHLNWITLYLPVWILTALSIGGLFGIYELGLRKRQPEFWVVLLFFAVSACCYLIDPKVNAIQPWAIRRFVPIVFPLFFLLSLAGWNAFLTYPFRNHWCFQKSSLVVLVSLIGGTFFHNSAFLLEQPILANTFAQVRRMAELTPSNALVIIPDSHAGYHLQIPLQYIVERDTLLLPLSDKPNKEFEQVIYDYLCRQLAKGRPVFVLLNAYSPPAEALLRQFALAFQFEGRVSFTYVPWVPAVQFPGRTELAVIDYLGFALGPPECSPSPGVINIGDPKQDLSHLLHGFYNPERTAQEPFRWTNGNAAMTLPFPCSNSPHELAIRVGFSGPDGTRLRVSIDGSELFGQIIPPGEWTGAFKINSCPAKERALIELSSDTFVPRRLLEGSTDDRTLGIALHAIGFCTKD
jgi:hypothetical protein